MATLRYEHYIKWLEEVQKSYPAVWERVGVKKSPGHLTGAFGYTDLTIQLIETPAWPPLPDDLAP